MKTIWLFIAACGLLTACGPPETPSGEEVKAPAGPASVATPPMLGGCILAEAIGDAPDDLYTIGKVHATDAYPPFTKALMVHGLLLVAGDEASDEFLRLVARTIAEIFPQDESLDLARQREIIAYHHLHRAVIPVPVGEDFWFMETEAFGRTAAHNSICDIIMQDVSSQVMEVVEHILHYVSDIGLAYAYPDEWGLSEQSLVAGFMRDAIAAGWYDIAQYEEIGPGTEEHLRVLIQEYAYWVISTYWDLQERYGPVGEAEWHIVTSAELQEKQPALVEMIARTVGRTMVPPSAATLREIGPTRAEERAAETG